MRILRLIAHMNDELCGAKEYAECYIEQKVKGNTQLINKYKEMAQDELKHATYIHDLIVSESNEISKSINPPTKLSHKWEKAHTEYVEKAAWIKQMLAL